MIKRKIANKGFSRIDRVLQKTAKDYNLEPALFRHQAIKNWHKIAGSFVEEALSQSKALDLKKGILTVACLTKELAAKLKVLAQTIIEALNQLLGRQVVFFLRLEL